MAVILSSFILIIIFLGKCVLILNDKYIIKLSIEQMEFFCNYAWEYRMN